MISTKKCLVCNKGRKNDTLYWHKDDQGSIWCWCNKCDRGYSIHSYCAAAGISLSEFLKGDFSFQESRPNEVRKMDWPSWFVPLHDMRATKGVEYVKSRGLSLEGDMYYDIDAEGIIFPYYFGNHFVGAQTRFITPRVHEDGDVQKMDTLPGSRLGLVFYGWNQERFMGDVKGVIVTEGSFNALAISQALSKIYGGIARSPWRAIACSGSGATQHHTESLKELKEAGLKIVCAPDSDEAGLKMLAKFNEHNAATHYVLTMDAAKDWNDLLKDMGHEEFSKYFLKNIKKIEELNVK
jgi:hypothetical protein